MVIQYDKLPFKFFLEESIISDYHKKIYTNDVLLKSDSVHLVDFFDDIDDLNTSSYKPQILITENRVVKIKVESEFDFKLEMEGFDVLEKQILIHDDGRYLSEANEYVEVFGMGEEFPLPPGNFVIKVSVMGKNYYAGFKVNSIRLDESLWKIMSEDVMKSVNLMAFQILNSKLSLCNKDYHNEVFGELILKMNVLNKYFTRVIKILDDLRIRPHSKISKYYPKVISEYSYLEDAKSYKLNIIKNTMDKEYISKKYTNYDLAENRFVKRVLLELDKIINLFISEIKIKLIILEKNNILYRNKGYSPDKNVNNVLNEYYNKAKQIKEAINTIRETEWFQMVNVNNSQVIPLQKMYDPRYGILNNLSNELKAKSIKYDIDNRLTLLWKRSDKLYEMWGFLKVVEQFQNIGFVISSGSNISIDNMLIKISSLLPGDYVQMQKENFIIKIYYDKEIPRERTNLNEEMEPIFVTSSNNRPDIRIDFYYLIDNIRYVASLIIDLKYRRRESIWPRDNSYNKYSCKVQLLNYTNTTKTQFHFDEPQQMVITRYRPVRQVWALYPNQKNVTEESDEFNQGVKLISFVPGHESVLIKHLLEFIDSIEEVVNWDIKRDSSYNL